MVTFISQIANYLRATDLIETCKTATLGEILAWTPLQGFESALHRDHHQNPTWRCKLWFTKYSKMIQAKPTENIRSKTTAESTL